MCKFAVRNLLSRPLRSLLALLGLTVAILGMVGLFSVAEGIDQTVSDTFRRIPGLAVMQYGAPIPLFSRLPAAWGAEMEKIPGVGVVNAEIWTRANIINGKRVVAPPRFLFGIDIETRLRLKHGIYSEAIVDGRYLQATDRGTLNAVISRQIATEHHKSVGDTLRVNGNDLPIVGIYHFGSLMLDVAIIVDIHQLRKVEHLSPDAVCNYYVEPNGEVDNPELMRRIETHFRGRTLDTIRLPSLLDFGSGDWTGAVTGFLKLFSPETGSAFPTTEDSARHDQPEASAPTPGSTDSSPPAAGTSLAPEIDDSPIEVRSATEWGERIEEFSSDLDIFLAIMTSIGVTIAVLSIVNTMLMSVSERIIEFGILKANGWSKADVMKLISIESGLLGLCGGVLGSALGWCGTQAINWKWPDQVHLFASPGLLAFGVGLSLLLGVLGGLYPAVWASRMVPMDAIRRGEH